LGHRSTQCYPQCMGECIPECFTQCMGECYPECFPECLGEPYPQCYPERFTQSLGERFPECIPECFTQCLGECFTQCMGECMGECLTHLSGELSAFVRISSFGFRHFPFRASGISAQRSCSPTGDDGSSVSVFEISNKRGGNVLTAGGSRPILKCRLRT
jgi:hypothetical protein